MAFANGWINAAATILLAMGFIWIFKIFWRLSKGSESRRIMRWFTITVLMFFMHGLAYILRGVLQSYLVFFNALGQSFLLLAGMSLLATAYNAARFYNQLAFEA